MVASTNPSAGENRALNISREREEATREILEIISRSRDDEKPVFDTILRSALRLCKVDMSVLAMLNEEGTHLELSASAGAQLVKFKPGKELWPVDSDLTVARAVRERRNIVTEDLRDDELYRRGDPTRVALVEKEGMRSQLVIPLLNGERAIGSFVLQRRKKRSFTQDEITLLQSFAAQAVIAIENVRQFRAIQTANAELQTRLEREAATRSILEVISRSRDDEGPVFDVILKNAARLCEAPLAYLRLIDAEEMSLAMVAHHGTSAAFVETVRANPLSLDAKDSDTARAVRERRVVHIEDLAEGEPYRTRQAHRVHAVETEGMRTLLLVPLLSGEACLGAISLYRREVNPFTPAQIALVETFAAQAVIAIENVRQFREIQTLNTTLEARVEAQIGEIERMGRLKRFLPPAVADAVVSSGSEAMLQSHRALIGILFADIRGFTAFCEHAEPEETIEVLQTYHEEMGKLISEHAAGVDHRSGDGIMLIFNDPLPCDDPAGEAVRMAVAMRARMAELCRDWLKLGHRLGFGVGISLGYATVGMVGSEGRYEYTASGTAVNLAARLCERAADGEILLSPRAFAAVEEVVEWEPGGELELKGLAAPVEVRKLRGLVQEPTSKEE